MDLRIFRNGKVVKRLNDILVINQNISEGAVEKIKELHNEKMDVLDLMKDSDDASELKEYAEMIEKIEYFLQETWGFEKNKNYHYWYMLPKCVCPKMDNKENYGTDIRIINRECPVHG